MDSSQRGVPKTPIIAMGSYGAVGGRLNFIIQILRIVARIPRRHWEHREASTP
jgi:hypothetical protein